MNRFSRPGRLQLALMGSLLVSSPTGVRAQDNCPDVGDPGSQSAELTLKKADATCTAEDGGYVKVDKQYKLHIAASTTGGCQTRVQDCFPLPCICVDSTYYPRALGATSLFDSVSPQYFAVVQPSNPWNIQAYDTTVPTGTSSTGASWVPATLGPRTFTSVTNVTPTPCGLSPTSFEEDEPLTVNVLKCEPKWYQVGSPPVTAHIPTANIKLYVPNELWDTLVGESNDGAAAAAANDWTAALSGTGITIQVVDTPCGSGPDCIRVGTASTAELGNACATFTAGSFNLTTGEVTAASDVKLGEDYWPEATQERLRRTIAHELAHALSLDHYSCATTDSLMGIPTVCPSGCQFTSLFEACTEHSGMSVSPSINDWLPVVSSTYGDHVQSVCGF